MIGFYQLSENDEHLVANFLSLKTFAFYMLYLALFHIVISICCVVTGLLFHQAISGGVVNKLPSYQPIVVYSLTGLVIVSAALQVFVLFIPVNKNMVVVFLFAICIAALTCRKTCYQYFRHLRTTVARQQKLTIGLIATIWCAVLLLSAGPTIMDDTDSYHIQIIKWTQQYGTVPGLANLHERFGFNTAWLTLVSLVAPQDSAYNCFSVLNGLLSVWVSSYLLVNFLQQIGKTRGEDDGISIPGLLLILFFCFVCWPLVRGNATNANYDFITTCMLLVLFVECWKSRKRFVPEPWLIVICFLWPAFLFTVRITNFPLLFISGYAFMFFLQHKNYSRTAVLFSLSAIMVTAWLARNVILSGYLFYPLYQIDLFTVDWKADSGKAQEMLDFIRYFNRVTYGGSIDEVKQLKGLNWLPVWFHYLLNYDKLLIILSSLGFGACVIKIRKLGSFNCLSKLFVAVLLLQLIAWLAIAPDTRFAYGPLLIGAYLSVAFLKWPFKQYFSIEVLVLPFLLGVPLCIYIINKTINDNNYRNFLVPVMEPKPPFTTYSTASVSWHIPEKILDNWNARCYGLPLPCLYKIQPGLQARSNDLKDGFKIKK